MPDFVPNFNDGPRNESPGEKLHRWAGNVGLLEKYFGAKFSASERTEIARFAIQVTNNLSKDDQKNIAATLAFAISWLSKMRTAM